MAPLAPYVLLPGTTREALTFYGNVFGCAVAMHTFADFGRDDGPADAIAHGYLVDGPVPFFAADASGDEAPLNAEGFLLALLGTADPATSRAWFAALAEGAVVVDELAQRPWGAWDGRVTDRYGVHWLIGFELPENGSATA